MKPRLVSLIINRRAHHTALAPNTTLLCALRDLGYTDVKSGCEKGDCGACGVLVTNETHRPDSEENQTEIGEVRIVRGTVINSCLLLAWLAENQKILTVAGLGTADNPHPLQKAFVDFGAAQCGYCIPGMILSAKALLDEHPKPTDEQLREALSGNLCRCTGYVKIFEAIQNVAQEMDRTQINTD